MLKRNSEYLHYGVRYFFLFLFIMISPIESRVRPSLSGSPFVEKTKAQIEKLGLSDSKVFLPAVMNLRGLAREAIWLHNEEPADHEIVLFRREFSIDEMCEEFELQVFADTRYQLWLDGTWVGRGPARFSDSFREYDVHRLGELSTGSHIITVLVQWAPNNRRSESQSPFLQASLWGIRPSGHRELIERSSSAWKAKTAEAWSLQSEPVHTWGLIGPTELMDLRKYDSEWITRSYEDGSWRHATVRKDAILAERPRSIPLLVDIPINPTVFDSGLLSPDMKLVEVSQGASQSIDFEVLEHANVKLEMLADPGTNLIDTVRLDGRTVTWYAPSAARPDVWSAEASLSPGSHSLDISEVSRTGETFAISTHNIDISAPFDQSLHAGRRLLLAEPISYDEAVNIDDSPSLSISFVDSPAYAVLDLGRTVHGRIDMEVSGPSGTVIDVGWDERLWKNKRPLPYPGSMHPQWNQVDSWVLDGMTSHVSTIDARAGRYVLLAVWGTGPVLVENIKVYEERYPVAERGDFDTSSDLLDRIWQVGVDSIYPNMNDAYTDTPWRERGQWWGDAFVEYKVNKVAFGDSELLERGLRLMADAFSNGQPVAMAPHGEGICMMDYGMLWVQSLLDYWRLTGDVSLLRDMFPTLLDFMSYLKGYKHSDTGLLSLPKTHWSKTVLIDWLAPHSRYGQSTAVNALYYATLQDASEIARALDKTERGNAWLQEASEIKEQMYDVLYDPEAGCYKETVYVEVNHAYEITTQSAAAISTCSPHAQAWALACEAVPEHMEVPVADALLGGLSRDPTNPNVDIYGIYWVLEALAKTERHSEAISIIEDLYGYLLSRGATTWWEGFSADQHYTASLSHGWGGAPTWYLTSHLLGATRTAPDMWKVAPAYKGLSRASGSLPLSSGDLGVNWRYEGCESFSLGISAPNGSSGSVILSPVREGMTVTVTLNEVVIWQNDEPHDESVTLNSAGLTVDIEEGGEYTFQIDRVCHDIYLPSVASHW